eukprot:GHVQ01033280.1.p1 GENE.GHVQ01033280.1~~GHVQ01033280.1.p1  ORF type:complete len:359 (+),score=54.52 GHVQ01033280.1:99-1175(+)
MGKSNRKKWRTIDVSRETRMLEAEVEHNKVRQKLREHRLAKEQLNIDVQEALKLAAADASSIEPSADASEPAVSVAATFQAEASTEKPLPLDTEQVFVLDTEGSGGADLNWGCMTQKAQRALRRLEAQRKAREAIHETCVSHETLNSNVEKAKRKVADSNKSRALLLKRRRDDNDLFDIWSDKVDCRRSKAPQCVRPQRIPAVKLPHAGQSYNPSTEEYEKCVQLVTEPDIKEIAARIKVQENFFPMTTELLRYFPESVVNQLEDSVKQRLLHQIITNPASIIVGDDGTVELDETHENTDAITNEDVDSDSHDNVSKRMPQKKSTSQRNRQARHRLALDMVRSCAIPFHKLHILLTCL